MKLSSIQVIIVPVLSVKYWRANVKHLLKNALLSNAQHGFVPKKSCSTNLLETMDIISSLLASGNQIDIVYTDFSKAFVKVSQRLLLSKLSAYEFEGKILDWVKNFLDERKQRVVLGNVESEWLNVTSGVPQGSVLGPLLFFFRNDLSESLSNETKVYAEDMEILSAVNHLNDNLSLQRDKNTVSSWAITWATDLNVEKCKVMHIGYKNPQFDYTIFNKYGTESLDKTKLEKNLGVLFQNDIKWGAHVSYSSGRTNKILGMIWKNFKFLDANVVKLLYASFVRPLIEYGVSVWNPYLKEDKN